MNPKLPWLNSGNDTGKHQIETIKKILKDFDEEITTLEVGSPYGGAVEVMATMIKGRGTAYGYDTFEGHPKFLADDPTSMEAVCMDPWYHETMLGREGLDYEFQKKVLKELGLTNAILKKGLVDEHSFDDIEKIHFAMLDMDLVKPTIVAYHAIKDKVVKGGYLFFHDALPEDHLPLINKFVYEEVIPSGMWKPVIEDGRAYLVGLKRI